MTDEKIFDKVMKILFDPEITMGKKSLLCLFAITENDTGESDLSNADICKAGKIDQNLLSVALKGMVDDNLISHQYMGSVTKGAKPVRRVFYPEREKTEQRPRNHMPVKEEEPFISIEEFRKKMGLDEKIGPKPVIEDLFTPSPECRVIEPSVATRRRNPPSSGKYMFTVYAKTIRDMVSYQCFIDRSALRKIGNPATLHARCPIGSDFIYLSAGNEYDIPVSFCEKAKRKNGQVGIKATKNLVNLLIEEKAMENRSRFFDVVIKNKELAINMRRSSIVNCRPGSRNMPEIER